MFRLNKEISRSWGFSALGSLESKHCIATGKMLTLNVTQLEECCTICRSVSDAFQYMIDHNDDYPHHSKNCNFSTEAFGASLTGTSFDVFSVGQNEL